MSEKTTSDILDFSEMSEDTKFRIKKDGEVFIIPSPTGAKSREIFEMLSSLEEKRKVAENEEKKEEDVSGSMDEFINFQNKFIAFVVVRENGESVTEKEVEEEWSMRVSLRIVKLISECISSSDKITEEEKK